MSHPMQPPSPSGNSAFPYFPPIQPGRDPISELKELVERENKERPLDKRIVFTTPDADFINNEWVSVLEYTSSKTGKTYREIGRSIGKKKLAASEACRLVLSKYQEDTQLNPSFSRMAILETRTPVTTTPSPTLVSSNSAPEVSQALDTSLYSPVSSSRSLPLSNQLVSSISPDFNRSNSSHEQQHSTPQLSNHKGNATQVGHSIWIYPDIILGKGGMGRVYEGYHEDPSKRAAVKKVNLSQSSKSNLEIIIHRGLDHANIVRYFASNPTQLNGDTFIAMELGDDTLQDVIRYEKYKSRYDLRKYMTQVAQGLSFLHEAKIIHRDLKPRNILIFKGTIAKIADFGISREVESIDEGGVTMHVAGSHGWMAPETSNKYSGHGDIFSFGLIIFYTMSYNHRHAFEEKGYKSETAWTSSLNQKISTNDSPHWHYLEEIEDAVSLRNLLTPLLSKEPNSRPKIDLVLEHPFFWDGLKFIKFITDTANELKKVKKELRSELDEKYDAFCMTLFKTHVNWKMRLCDLVRLNLLVKSNHSKTYDAGSVLSLIEFIRDKEQHAVEWRQSQDLVELRDVLGTTDEAYGEYFTQHFPELATFLYTHMQEIEFQNVFVKVKQEFYKLNCKSIFDKL
ncbi:serine/threonine-protein kinase ppk4-like isoform X2 [Folsomia candida]|uniref:serine/threonine-protein kinase ppk4-like isoform X2 n=1 Tax=Folsomia candida TaxID=158441 RepID=UPI001604DDF8|nr:serine/threonine-protein kinase ppk4-like isoform X2 [Folsomia candida]